MTILGDMLGRPEPLPYVKPGEYATAYNLDDMTVDGPLNRSKLLTRDDFTEADAARFWSKVNRHGGDGGRCWEWTGGRTWLGYGQFNFDRRSAVAHRCALALAIGVVPAGLAVRHACDNRVCCNPIHLQLGSTADNVRDMDSRGRRVTVEGEGSGTSKLTVEAVNAMRRLARQGATYVELGREYGVGDATAQRAVTGRSWPSASEPPVAEVRLVRRPWRADEDAFIMRTLDVPLKMVAASLGRTRSGVSHRRCDLTR